MPALWPSLGISRSRAGMLARPRSAHGEPLDGSALDLPPDRLDGAVLQLGRRRFKRLRKG